MTQYWLGFFLVLPVWLQELLFEEMLEILPIPLVLGLKAFDALQNRPVKGASPRRARVRRATPPTARVIPQAPAAPSRRAARGSSATA